MQVRLGSQRTIDGTRCECVGIGKGWMRWRDIETGRVFMQSARARIGGATAEQQIERERLRQEKHFHLFCMSHDIPSLTATHIVKLAEQNDLPLMTAACEYMDEVRKGRLDIDVRPESSLRHGAARRPGLF